MATQLEGSIKFGADSGSAVEVGTEVFSLKLIEERATNTRRPTFANAVESVRAGASKNMFEVEFEETLDPSTSLAHKAVTAAVRSDSGEMYVEGTLKPGTVSASNPKYSGTVIVDSVSTGGEVGSELEQSHTWTVNEDGISIDTGS
jgi:hypothetical protein